MFYLNTTKFDNSRFSHSGDMISGVVKIGHYLALILRYSKTLVENCWLGPTPLELSSGVVCVILRLGVLEQWRRVTDRQTDTRRHHIPR